MNYLSMNNKNLIKKTIAIKMHLYVHHFNFFSFAAICLIITGLDWFITVYIYYISHYFPPNQSL